MHLIKYNEVSIYLYSINQFYLIKKNYFKKIYLTKNQK